MKFLKWLIFENSRVSARAQNSLQSFCEIYMNEKVKTAIGCYFLLLYFESRGQPSSGGGGCPLDKGIHEIKTGETANSTQSQF